VLNQRGARPDRRGKEGGDGERRGEEIAVGEVAPLGSISERETIGFVVDQRVRLAPVGLGQWSFWPRANMARKLSNRFWRVSGFLAEWSR